MKKKEKKKIVTSQKEVDEILKETSKEKKKNRKENKKKEQRLSKKWLIPSIIALIVVIIIGILIAYKYEKDRISIKKELVIQSGAKVPTLDDFVGKMGTLSPKSEVKYTNLDKKVENPELSRITIYTNDKGEEIEKTEAFEKKDDKEVLKKNYKEQVIIKGTGTYKVVIKDNKTKRLYHSTLKVIDEEKAKITLKESVEVEQNSPISPTDFIQEQYDNSHEDLEFFFVEEKKENGKTTYNKIDISTDEVKELSVIILAKDKSKNETIAKSKLIIKEKAPEEEPEEVQTSSNGGSTGGNSGGRTYSRGGSYRGNSGGNSGGSAPAGCGSQGYSTAMYGAKGPNEAYVWFGCGGSGSVSQYHSQYISQFQPASLAMIRECNARYGESCVNNYGLNEIYDNATGKIVGLVSVVDVYDPSWNKVASGYFKSSGQMQWNFRNF